MYTKHTPGSSFGLAPRVRSFGERLNLGQISSEIVVPRLFGQRFDTGAGEGGAGGQGGAGDQGAGGGDAGAGAGAGGETGAGQGGQGGDTGENGIEAPVGGVPFADLPKTTQDEVRRLRTRDRERTQTIADLQGKQTPDGATVLTPEARRALGVALGYEQNAEPSGEELASRVSQTQEENAALNRANMVLRVAAGQGANADVLLDSTAFLQTIKGLDPATQRQEFEQKIKAWVSDHPYAALQQSQAAGSSGGQHQSSGSGAAPTRKGLGAAIDAALKN